MQNLHYIEKNSVMIFSNRLNSHKKKSGRFKNFVETFIIIYNISNTLQVVDIDLSKILQILLHC